MLTIQDLLIQASEVAIDLTHRHNMEWLKLEE